jgi:predicted peptidase
MTPQENRKPAQRPYEYGSFRGMPYRLHRPWLKADERAPLILFLHGAGERGSDNEAQIGYGFFRSAAGIFGETRYFVLAPQAPADDAWTSVRKWSEPVVTLAPHPTQALATALALMDEVVREEQVDPRKVAVVGLSMGAFGCFDAVARRPETFAAAVAVCGNGDPAAAQRMARVPFWLAHGVDDPLVPVTGSKTMAEALRHAGCDVTYEALSGVGHAAWDPAFSDERLVTWLRRRLG